MKVQDAEVETTFKILFDFLVLHFASSFNEVEVEQSYWQRLNLWQTYISKISIDSPLVRQMDIRSDWSIVFFYYKELKK